MMYTQPDEERRSPRAECVPVSTSRPVRGSAGVLLQHSVGLLYGHVAHSLRAAVGRDYLVHAGKAGTKWRALRKQCANMCVFICLFWGG